MPKIKFTYLEEYFYEVAERPKPSKNFIPDWFRNMGMFEKSPENPDGTKLMIRNMSANKTAKQCMPMLDAMLTGYTIPLWSDVQVTQDDESNPYITWRVSQPLFELHGRSSMDIPEPPGYNKMVFKYIPHFRVETPPGYSIMIRPVAGFYDPVFMPVTAIVDTDKEKIDTNFPIWVKDGFEGIVEKGTPIAQIIPFKREDWSSEFSWMTEKKYMMELDKHFQSNLIQNYKRNVWGKKNYS